MTMAKTDKRQDSRRKKSDEVQDLVMNRTELHDSPEECSNPPPDSPPPPT